MFTFKSHKFPSYSTIYMVYWDGKPLFHTSDMYLVMKVMTHNKKEMDK